jgi:putative transposase
MPNRTMRGTGGLIFHILNRGVRRLRLFDHDGDYRVFLRSFAEAQARVPVQVFAFCVMPNHFHLVVRPAEDGQLAHFMRLATVTHAKRWHEYRGTTGTGAVYQGRYKAFPVQTDRYFVSVCRYVEANALRAGLVARAEDWRWSSLAMRGKKFNTLTLSEWPILPPPNWSEIVNELPASSEVDQLRLSVRRNAPFGDREWTTKTGEALNLGAALRQTGRPRKRTSGVISQK